MKDIEIFNSKAIIGKTYPAVNIFSPAVEKNSIGILYYFKMKMRW